MVSQCLKRSSFFSCKLNLSIQLPAETSSVTTSATTTCTDATQGRKLFLHRMAHQRVAEIPFSQQQQTGLTEFKNRTSLKAQFEIASKLLLKEVLTVEKEYIIELSISNIKNYISPLFQKYYHDMSLRRDTIIPDF